MALINGVVGLENVKDADLVIEAVFETMAIKKEVFEKLDQYAKRARFLASNTSYLHIDEIAKVTNRPQTCWHALLQPGERDEAVRNRARRQDRARMR